MRQLISALDEQRGKPYGLLYSLGRAKRRAEIAKDLGVPASDVELMWDSIEVSRRMEADASRKGDALPRKERGKSGAIMTAVTDSRLKKLGRKKLGEIYNALVMP